MNYRNHRVALLSAVFFAATFNTASSWAQQSQDPLISSMVKAGVAKIAIASLPPYAYPGPDGAPKGYLIDVVTEVTKALGIAKLEATVTTWDAMIPGLQAKQFSFVPAGLSVSAARCQVVIYTSPIQAGQDAMYVKPGDETKITGYSYFIRSPDAKLSVLTGSVQESYVVNKLNIPRSQVLMVPDVQAGIAAVLGGRAAAFAVGEYSVSEPGKKGVRRVVDTTSPATGMGVVFRKEDIGARDAFDKQLDILRANGTMKKLYADVYGHSNWDVLAKLKRPSDIEPTCH